MKKWVILFSIMGLLFCNPSLACMKRKRPSSDNSGNSSKKRKTMSATAMKLLLKKYGKYKQGEAFFCPHYCEKSYGDLHTFHFHFGECRNRKKPPVEKKTVSKKQKKRGETTIIGKKRKREIILVDDDDDEEERACKRRKKAEENLKKIEQEVVAEEEKLENLKKARSAREQNLRDFKKQIATKEQILENIRKQEAQEKENLTKLEDQQKEVEKETKSKENIADEKEQCLSLLRREIKDGTNCLEEVEKAWRSEGKELEHVKKSLAENENLLEEHLIKIKEVRERIEQDEKKLDEVRDELNRVRECINKEEKELETLRTQGEDEGKRVTAESKELEAVRNEVEGKRKAFDGLGEKIVRAKENVVQEEEKLKKVRETREQEGKQVREERKELGEIEKAIEMDTKKLDGVKRDIDKEEKKLRDVKKKLEKIQENIALERQRAEKSKKQTKNKRKRYSCSTCKRNFSDHRALFTHISSKLCGAPVSESSSTESSEDSPEDPPETKYSCPLCRGEFFSSSEYTTHLTTRACDHDSDDDEEKEEENKKVRSKRSISADVDLSNILFSGARRTRNKKKSYVEEKTDKRPKRPKKKKKKIVSAKAAELEKYLGDDGRYYCPDCDYSPDNYVYFKHHLFFRAHGHVKKGTRPLDQYFDGDVFSCPECSYSKKIAYSTAFNHMSAEHGPGEKEKKRKEESYESPKEIPGNEDDLFDFPEGGLEEEDDQFFNNLEPEMLDFLLSPSFEIPPQEAPPQEAPPQEAPPTNPLRDGVVRIDEQGLWPTQSAIIRIKDPKTKRKSLDLLPPCIISIPRTFRRKGSFVFTRLDSLTQQEEGLDSALYAIFNVVCLNKDDNGEKLRCKQEVAALIMKRWKGIFEQKQITSVEEFIRNDEQLKTLDDKISVIEDLELYEQVLQMSLVHEYEIESDKIERLNSSGQMDASNIRIDDISNLNLVNCSFNWAHPDTKRVCSKIYRNICRFRKSGETQLILLRIGNNFLTLKLFRRENQDHIQVTSSIPQEVVDDELVLSFVKRVYFLFKIDQISDSVVTGIACDGDGRVSKKKKRKVKHRPSCDFPSKFLGRNGVYCCPSCDYKTKNNKKFWQHCVYNTHGPISLGDRPLDEDFDSDEKKFLCPLCGDKYEENQYADFCEHYYKGHSNKESREKVEKYRLHRRSLYDRYKQDDGKLYCPDCEEYFGNEKALQNHFEENKHGPKWKKQRYKIGEDRISNYCDKDGIGYCPCGYMSKDMRTLSAHFRDKAHGHVRVGDRKLDRYLDFEKQVFVCPECGKTYLFNQCSAFRSHLSKGHKRRKKK